MKSILCGLFAFYTAVAFAQEPPFEVFVTLKNVDTTQFDYRIHILDNYGNLAIDSLTDGDGRQNYSQIEISVMKANDNQLLIVGYYFSIYDNSKFRIAVLRKKKSDNQFEMMYATCPMRIGSTIIEINDFIPGERTFDCYLPLKNWLHSNWFLSKSFDSQRIYIH